LGVGIPHIVQDGDRKLGGVTGFASCCEAQNLGGGCAIGTGDLIVVGLSRLEVIQRNFVEEFAALGDSFDLRAGRGAAIAGEMKLALIYQRSSIYPQLPVNVDPLTCDYIPSQHDPTCEDSFPI
jgi:hypothetical protein